MSIVCGHRGLGPTRASGSFPENTIESIEAAIEAGATMVEFDVQLSADDVPVLMHDDTLDRTTTGRGCVSASTLAELRMLDAGVGTPLCRTGRARGHAERAAERGARRAQRGDQGGRRGLPPARR
jgi:glycerophosphoryl diester phosphodiesterase